MRSDVKLLSQYLQLRNYVTGLLQHRAAAGGASTLAAQANADLRNMFAFGVVWLNNQNTYFKRFAYDGLIEFDQYLNDTELADAG